uniref:RNA-directed DNA polymerase, eukaryota, reverse transcriptase zinc-binding domain protein n=1 Tax=Tanacetum cinerariifolium TaxID=118510 RepID=A0A699L5G3_TANCI|nr:RNA-directed DNA polymerase, eukaryota, reverse transcriptase zinc-binding domain protein [Tanacetum cinerariifolium]
MAWYRKKKKELMVFKVDFEKAFDSLRWDYLDEIMKKLGFGSKWRNWIVGCLSNSRTSILVNGTPTAEFEILKGLRQGDPLSPFLFIIAIEGLHAITSKAVNIDDATFVGEWSHQNAYNLICMLRCFYLIFGLKINVHKSSLVGVSVSDVNIIDMASVLGCVVVKIPMVYLGVPVGCNMNRIDNWKCIV